jgi:hypothetical protein
LWSAIATPIHTATDKAARDVIKAQQDANKTKAARLREAKTKRQREGKRSVGRSNGTGRGVAMSSFSDALMRQPSMYCQACKASPVAAPRPLDEHLKQGFLIDDPTAFCGHSRSVVFATATDLVMEYKER